MSNTVVLCVLDGFGVGEALLGNAIAQANTPNLDRLLKQCPHSLIQTSEEAVGLPKGQVGNSEVGHLTIGSGRVIIQDLPKIDQAIASGSLSQHPLLLGLPKDKRCHLIGLISDGGVHGHIKHTIALANILRDIGVHVVLHAITDGRDCSPRSAIKYLDMIQQADLEIATLVGRYYAMDRDSRWERIKLAYQAIVNGQGVPIDHPIDAVHQSYEQNITDEFIIPSVVGTYQGIDNGDSVICTNFRADRTRQLLESMLTPEVNQQVDIQMPVLNAIGMVPYSAALQEIMPALFPKENITNTLGETVAHAGKAQLRVAETEKYAHITYFLNGGREEPFPKESRILIKSPNVSTYDLTPKMSAAGITDAVVEATQSAHYDLICINYANADMVGHTGNMDATIKAIEELDLQIGRLQELTHNKDWHLLITADHGNAEHMLDETKGPHTAHTTNLVPLIYAGPRISTLHNGTLADIAHTILDLMELKPPVEMTGRSLLK